MTQGSTTEAAIGPDGAFDEGLFAAYMKFNEDMHKAGVLVQQYVLVVEQQAKMARIAGLGQANGEFVGSAKRFADQLVNRGFARWRNGSTDQRGFQGLAPRHPPTEFDELRTATLGSEKPSKMAVPPDPPDHLVIDVTRARARG